MSESSLTLSASEEAEFLSVESAQENAHSEFAFVNADLTDKTKRTAIHALVRELYSSSLVSETKVDGDTKVLVVKSRVGGAGRSSDRRTRHNRESVQQAQRKATKKAFKDAYVSFGLLKVNMETNHVLSLLKRSIERRDGGGASKNARKRKFTQMAIDGNVTLKGMKDKRGVTTQRVCAKYETARALIAAHERRPISTDRSSFYVLTQPIQLEERGFKLGNDLGGNAFVVTLRELTSSSSQEEMKRILRNRVETLKTNGYLNYFGMQRFGTMSVPTHEYGVLLIKGDERGFLRALLRAKDMDSDDVSAAKTTFLSALLDDEDDSTAQSKPSTTENVVQFGREVLEKIDGRMTAERKAVISLIKNPSNISAAVKSVPHNLRTLYVRAYQSYVFNALVTRRYNKHGLALLDTDVRPNGSKCESIYDVVLPLFGSQVRIPTEYRSEVAEILKKDDLTLEEIESERFGKMKVFGTHRTFIGAPWDVSCEFVQYAREDDELTRSPLRLVKDENDPQDEIEKGPLLAARVSFSLTQGSYATMALRQLVKTSTT